MGLVHESCRLRSSRPNRDPTLPPAGWEPRSRRMGALLDATGRRSPARCSGAGAAGAARWSAGRTRSVVPGRSLPAEILALLAELMDAKAAVLPPAKPHVLAADPAATGTFVVRMGDAAVKIHPADSDPRQLQSRFRIASGLPDLFLPPIAKQPMNIQGRIITVWPYRPTIKPDRPDEVPWEASARLLAQLHLARPAESPLPAQQMPASVLDALTRLAATPDELLAALGVPRWARGAVNGAASVLPAWALDRWARPAPGRPSALIHGDWHLGQLVKATTPAGEHADPWRLIDIDALGAGDPVWDLSRPAMWLLAGIISPADWRDFLHSYCDAGGIAVPSDGGWHILDPAAQAAAVQAAASALARAARSEEPLDDVANAFLEACRRIAAA